MKNRKNPKKTDPAQMLIPFNLSLQLYLTLGGEAVCHVHHPAVVNPHRSVQTKPVGIPTPLQYVNPEPPKKKRAKSTYGGPLRTKVRNQVNILARQSGLEVHDVWCHAYKELLHRTGFNATAMSDEDHNHLDMVQMHGHLEDLLAVLDDMQRSALYAPSMLV